MVVPLKVLDLELSQPLPTLECLDRYAAVKALVRLHGTPLGYIHVPVLGGRCSAPALGNAILEQHSWAVLQHLLTDLLAGPAPPGGFRVADLVGAEHSTYTGPLPSVTVAVCTRNRP